MGEYLFFTPLFEGNPLSQRHEILSRKTSVFVTAHSEDIVILACTVLIRLKDATDRRTDGRFDDG